MVTISFTYDDVPPSMNTNAIRSHWRGFQRHKKAWQSVIETLLLADYGRPPEPFGRVTVTVRLAFPEKRGRDPLNFRTLLDKATGDALTNGGWIPDDTAEHYQFDDPLFVVERGGRKRTQFIFTFHR